ncbi:hypothetical protein KAR91_11890, partial [Candidatus Pacearchaeota archaeon]|nr:hypothetical protein [Candidatus Pacearchaeota archaeon]
MRKLILVLVIICAVVITGCGRTYNPTYLTDRLTFGKTEIVDPLTFEKIESVNGLPIKVRAEDNRTHDKKYFLKLGFITYYENKPDYIQLERSSKEIIQTAFGEGFRRGGFTLDKKACVVANISVEKFFCTISGAEDNEAVIELDLSLKENGKTIYHKHILETYRQKFNAFRQNEDAESLLSECLTMGINKTLGNTEFANQIATNAQSFKLSTAPKLVVLAEEFNTAKVTEFDDTFFVSSRGEFESKEDYSKRVMALKNEIFYFDTKVSLFKYDYDKARFADISIGTNKKSESGISYLSLTLNEKKKPANTPLQINGYLLKWIRNEKGIVAKNILEPHNITTQF